MGYYLPHLMHAIESNLLPAVFLAIISVITILIFQKPIIKEYWSIIWVIILAEIFRTSIKDYLLSEGFESWIIDLFYVFILIPGAIILVRRVRSE